MDMNDEPTLELCARCGRHGRIYLSDDKDCEGSEELCTKIEALRCVHRLWLLERRIDEKAAVDLVLAIQGSTLPGPMPGDISLSKEAIFVLIVGPKRDSPEHLHHLAARNN